MLRFAAALWALSAFGQTQCPDTPIYTPCDLVMELPPQAAQAHPNPYLSVQLHAEFRSPRARTYLMPGFWDGGSRFVIRFSPTDPGRYDFRITSNIESFHAKSGSFNALASEHDGFLRVDNVHHFSHTETRKPHLWMGDTCYRFAWLKPDVFQTLIETRAKQRFNHLRGLAMHNDERFPKAFSSPDLPNHAHFQELDRRIRALNEKGIFFDLVLAADRNHLAEVFPKREQRERFIRYMVARYSAMAITWQGVQEFEEYHDGRALLKEIGELLKKHDPYRHPRSTHTVATAAPLANDGWMNYVTYQSSDNALGAIERQLLQAPMVNAEFAYENSGAGKSHPHHVDSETFRKRLWNATMNGQYPTYGNTGTYGGRAFEVDPAYLDSPGARAMSAWYEVMSRARFWELNPFFEVTGGRALALPGIEYIVYVERAGTVEIVTEKKTYQVYWIRPSTGEVLKQKKEFKDEKFVGGPPDDAGDWILHLSRDGRKEGMLKSWKFESRPVFVQEIERNPAKIPYEIVTPSADLVKAGEDVPFEIKITRQTRASSAMLFLWTAEATTGSQGYRVVGSGLKGVLKIPTNITADYPAVLNLRLYGMNLNGKVYALDRVLKAGR